MDLRMREEGMLLAGEIFVTLQLPARDLSSKMESLKKKAINYHWRIDVIVVTLETTATKTCSEAGS